MEITLKDLLIHSLDNELTPTQQAHLEKALVESETLRQEKEQLLQMRSLIAELRVRRDLSFPERVINRLHTKEKRGFFSDLVALSPRVAAASVIFIVAMTVGIYLREGSLSSDVIIGIEELTPEDAFGIENEKLFRSSSDRALEGPQKEKPKEK